MQDNKKIKMLFGVIIVCVVAAGTITWSTTRGKHNGIDSIPDDVTTWLKCRNPACEHEYQIPLREYYENLEDETLMSGNGGMTAAQPLICPKCGEPSVYKAVKCPMCGLVFETAWKRGDFEDRCPKCGYSQIEKNRQETAAHLRE